MFIGGAFIKKLYMTRTEVEKLGLLYKIGRALWAALMVVELLAAVILFLTDGQSETATITAATISLAYLCLLGNMLCVFTYAIVRVLYGYAGPKGSGGVAFYVAILLCFGALAAVAVWLIIGGWQYFTYICQNYPSHPALIIPLGLTVEYLTAVGCAIVKVLYGSWCDYQSWQMARWIYPPWHDEENPDDYFPGIQLSFKEFVAEFNT